MTDEMLNSDAFNELSQVQRHVFHLMDRYGRNKDGEAFPSHSKLAKNAGVNRRTIIRSLQHLESAGFLKTISGGHGSETHYSVVKIPPVLTDDSPPTCDTESQVDTESHVTQSHTPCDFDDIQPVTQSHTPTIKVNTKEKLSSRRGPTRERARDTNQSDSCESDTTVKIPPDILQYLDRVNINNPEVQQTIAKLTTPKCTEHISKMFGDDAAFVQAYWITAIRHDIDNGRGHSRTVDGWWVTRHMEPLVKLYRRVDILDVMRYHLTQMSGEDGFAATNCKTYVKNHLPKWRPLDGPKSGSSKTTGRVQPGTHGQYAEEEKLLRQLD